MQIKRKTHFPLVNWNFPFSQLSQSGFAYCEFEGLGKLLPTELKKKKSKRDQDQVHSQGEEIDSRKRVLGGKKREKFT